MKTIILFISAVLTFNSSFAKIWRVNNNQGITADFKTAQAANDSSAVMPGDTIHLEPSTASYGDLYTSKRLVWISIGYFTGAHPGEEYSAYSGKVDFLGINPGSDNSVFSINANAQCRISAANIGLIRCYINVGITFSTVNSSMPSNDLVMNCYIAGSILVYTGSNHNITNNIVEGYLYIAPAGGATVTNNVFNAVTTGPNYINNSVIQNNIFNKTNSPYTFTLCDVEYNMSGAANILPAGNSNQNNVLMSTVFINDNGTSDGDFVLKASSPALGAGIGGIDMGAYGGSTPFRAALQPAIPAIYKIIAPASPTGNTMNVTFSTKSNN